MAANAARTKKKAELIEGNRVIVWDPEEGSQLYGEGFYGQPLGIRKPKTPQFNKPLELSLLEALYLLEKGRIRIYDAKDGHEITRRELEEKAEETYLDFKTKYVVYKDLREKGLVVRPALKFGADYAVYQHGPGIDHAPLIVSVVPEGTKLNPVDIVRAGRLATSVRKKFVIATVDPSGEPRYYVFSWFKP
ncbi:MAG: tRNA-intron lyase [Candidatus Freyarchaeota archaeon]|nr:tRNA-intron lyase [Candidatus Freyrarchaeum guaymaensis]HDO80071.1 tRNA-intron lyase [Candidatus Bathyarchaeota archaeon]